jgi:hypothetical protein
MSGGRPMFDLSPWQGILYSWYILEDRSLEACHNAFQITFPDAICPSIRTLKRIFTEWEFKKRDDQLLREPILQARVWHLFHEQCLNDEHILRWLARKDGIEISKRQ